MDWIGTFCPRRIHDLGSRLGACTSSPWQLRKPLIWTVRPHFWLTYWTLFACLAAFSANHCYFNDFAQPARSSLFLGKPKNSPLQLKSQDVSEDFLAQGTLQELCQMRLVLFCSCFFRVCCVSRKLHRRLAKVSLSDTFQAFDGRPFCRSIRVLESCSSLGALYHWCSAL